MSPAPAAPPLLPPHVTAHHGTPQWSAFPMRPSLFSPASQGPSQLAVSLLSAHPDRPSHACPSQWQSLTCPSKLLSARALASRHWHGGHPDTCFPILDAPGRLTAGEGGGGPCSPVPAPSGWGKVAWGQLVGAGPRQLCGGHLPCRPACAPEWPPCPRRDAGREYGGRGPRSCLFRDVHRCCGALRAHPSHAQPAQEWPRGHGAALVCPEKAF